MIKYKGITKYILLAGAGVAAMTGFAQAQVAQPYEDVPGVWAPLPD